MTNTASTARPSFKDSGTYAYGPAESSRIRSTATKAEIERYENEHLIIPSGVEWTPEMRKLSTEIHMARDAWDAANED